MTKILETLCSYVWGTGLVSLLLVTGAVFTVKLGFVQFKMFPFVIKAMRGRESSRSGGLSQRRTVCMSLGTAMGTGNITGVAAALAVGGPGAVFWMWISAFLGMALVYAENSLSVIYSRDDEKGPMAYMSRGLGSRKLACIFAVCCIAAAFGMGGMVQAGAFSDSLLTCVDAGRPLAAVFIFFAVSMIVKGGSERIGRAAEILLPAAGMLYAAAGIAVIVMNRNSLLPAFSQIFTHAAGIKQAAGGIGGHLLSKAVSVGIQRGIFSNEAGLGSSPLLHSAAADTVPENQAMWSMFEVFIDTVVCCTLTALVILCGSDDMTVSGAFRPLLGEMTGYFLTAEISVFAFCTMIGWYYCAGTAFTFLTGKRAGKLLPIVYAGISSLGALFAMKTVWTLSDIFNGLMAYPNLLALLLLMKKVNKPRPGGNTHTIK